METSTEARASALGEASRNATMIKASKRAGQELGVWCYESVLRSAAKPCIPNKIAEWNHVNLPARRHAENVLLLAISAPSQANSTVEVRELRHIESGKTMAFETELLPPH
jgi:hypothetical protein